MAPRGCIADAEPYASRTRGTHVPRGKASRSEPSDSSRGWNDETWRCGLLHASALLSIAEFEISTRDPKALASSAGHAHGWTTRGEVACADSQESRMHASGCRTRPRRSWEGYGRHAILSPVRGAGAL